MPEMTFGEMRAEAKTQGFEPIPIGTYNFRVEAVDLKPGKGSQQISTKIVIMDGPLAGRSTLNRLVPIKNDGDVNGMFFRQCKVLGVGDDHPIWAQIDAVGLDQGIGLLAPLLIGGMFIGEIEIQPWMGEDRDNVKSMKPYGGVPTGIPLTAGVVPGAVPGAVPTGVPTAPVAPVPAPLAPVPVTPPPLSPVAPAAVTQVATPIPVPAPGAPVEAVPSVVPEAVVPPQPAPVPVAPPTPEPVAPPAPVETEVVPPPVVPPPPPDDAPF